MAAATIDRTHRRAVVVAPDAQAIAALSARAERCGINVIGAFEGLSAPTAGFDPAADLIIVDVPAGQELRGYYIGRAAAVRGIAIIFVAIHKTPAIEAMVRAVPLAVLIEQSCNDAVFLAQAEAATHNADAE